MADVLSNYRTGEAFDEMIDGEGSVRPSYKAVYATLQQSSAGDLRGIAESLAKNYTRAGVTFDVGGVERPFPLDLVPRVIASPEWETIEAGVAQRVKALEAFLADVYSGARVISDGVIPSQLVTSSNHYHRAVWGVQPGNGVRIHVAGVDLDPHPGRRRAGARGQRPGAERRVVRDDQPQRHDHRDAERVRQPADPCRGELSDPIARRTAQGRPAGNRSADRRRAHPGRLQLGLLRAHAAGPHDGRRTGRGPRPGMPPGQGLHADHVRAAAGRCDLSADRRRLHRPGALPQRLHARRAGAGQRRAHRRRGAGQRDRQRGRRRQVDLHLRPGPDPLLPPRRSRSSPTSTPGGWRTTTRARRCSIDSPSSWSSRSTARAARAS